MNISSVFIERPIFAAVLAILIATAGLLAIPSLPISEYPEIVPPTVVVSGQYPGASPKTIAETVITPLEQQINGVENAIYTNSVATPTATSRSRSPSGSGPTSISAGADAESRHAGRAALAGCRAPGWPDHGEALARPHHGGVPEIPPTVDMTRCICAITRSSRSGMCCRACPVWAMCRCSVLATTPCVCGSTRPRWPRSVSVSMKCSPRCASRTCRWRRDRSAASRRCPAVEFQYIVNAQGRLQTEQEFGNIVVKNGANGETTYLRDIARLELGPETYALRSMLDGDPAVAIPVFQLPEPMRCSSRNRCARP